MKKKIIICCAIVAFLLAMLTLFLLRDKTRSWDEIIDSGILRVATNYNNVDYYIDNGKPVGLSYELIKEFADSLNLILEVNMVSNYSERVEGLSKGEYDVVISHLPINVTTKSQMLMSEPLLNTKLVLVQAASQFVDDSVYIAEVMQLDGKTICIEKNSPYMLVLDNLKDEMGLNFNIKEIDNVDSEMLCGMVIRGEAKYVVIDLISARIECEYRAILDSKLNLSFDHFVGWGITESDILKSQLDSFIVNKKSTESWGVLKSKYVRP